MRRNDGSELFGSESDEGETDRRKIAENESEERPFVSCRSAQRRFDGRESVASGHGERNLKKRELERSRSNQHESGRSGAGERAEPGAGERSMKTRESPESGRTG